VLECLSMEVNVLIGGPAGEGVGRTSHLLGKAIVEAGGFVFNYRDYPSLIRGGHNFNILKISDQPVSSHEWQVDLIVAFDQQTIDLHQKERKEKGIIIASSQFESSSLVGIDLAGILQKLEAKKVVGNNIFLGVIFKALSLSFESLRAVLKKEFKSSMVVLAAKAGYDLSVSPVAEFKFEKEKERFFLTGNEAIAAGALQGGLETYFAYPMTPATAVLGFLQKAQKETGVKAIQLENEIAVANAALGASFAGNVSMLGTSGGGLGLMAEALSLQGMSELPLVAYLSQRAGPSTGVPTYTSQGDLNFALNIGHGEFPRLVVAPGDVKEAYERTQEALYLAMKYRSLVILLGDKHLGENEYVADELKDLGLKSLPADRQGSQEDYSPYRITESGVSPFLPPGQGPISRATSYEHDEKGLTTEESEPTIKMNDKRFRKLKGIEKEVAGLNPVSYYGNGNGENLIVAWGSTKGAIIDALKDLPDWSFLQISWLSPFPCEAVLEKLKTARRVVLVENSATGQLANLISKEIQFKIKEKILKYDGRPFTVREIVKELKNG